MSRYIDADKVLDGLADERYMNTDDYRKAVSVVGNTPTADVVEVVRCRDCKHWHDNTEFCDFWSGLNVAQRTISTSYCSYGERKDEK